VTDLSHPKELNQYPDDEPLQGKGSSFFLLPFLLMLQLTVF